MDSKENNLNTNIIQSYTDFHMVFLINFQIEDNSDNTNSLTNMYSIAPNKRIP